VSSKRDEDAGDMEVGMTTAERRRRRRRGAGLRVPSDNVPRSRTPTAPPAPVPEDPALAMSIAYSFSNNDASGPVPRSMGEIVAPEAMPTVIDPPSAPVGEEDFEMRTREMSAVDLEALGLSNDVPGSSMPRMASPGVRLKSSEVDVDVSIDSDVHAAVTAEQPAIEPAPERKKPLPGSRHKTVALSEEDLEEVRAATQPVLAAQAAADRAAAQKRSLDSNSTMPLQAIDVEMVVKRDSEPMSVPDIDIQELADRAESSGEIDVDVDTDEKVEEPAVARTKTPSAPPPVAVKFPRAQSVPPVPSGENRKSGVIDATHTQHAPSTGSAPAAHPPATPPAPPAAAAQSSGAHTSGGHPTVAHPPPTPAAAAHPPAANAAHHPPPPPPAAAHQHKPPAPPPGPHQKPAAKQPIPQAAVAAAVAKEPSKPTSSRARAWFVDLFDEDYLRTLPFLTPQATQSEAEFVINAMNLAPGAQVLDLGCGYGRHAMELAARGFHVVGLDLSTPLLVRGGEEAHRRGLTINFVRGDMRELDFENQFDGVYCLFSTFGYFDDETNKKTLQNVARALKPNGKILVEILNRDYVIADLPTRVWWEGDGCVVLEEVELNYFSSRIQVNRSVVFDDGRQLEQEISVRAYSLHEVGKLMHAAGFRVLEVSGGYQMRGRFFGNQSRHIIVLAERKETSGT
jgi:SAM-dependent methyltransferase